MQAEMEETFKEIAVFIAQGVEALAALIIAAGAIEAAVVHFERWSLDGQNEANGETSGCVSLFGSC